MWIRRETLEMVSPPQKNSPTEKPQVHTHPAPNHQPLRDSGMPSSLLMTARMWLPLGPALNKYHSSPAQFKQARQMGIKVHTPSRRGGRVHVCVHVCAHEGCLT